MRLAAAALAAALLTALAPAAHAFPPNATDRGCSLVTATDASTATPGAQFGYVLGGPIRQNGTLLCTVKVNASTHSAPYFQGGSGSATGTTGTTQLLPVPVAFVVPAGVPVWVCSQFTDGGGTTYYWDGANRVWTTNSGAECGLVTEWSTGDPIFDPVFDLADSLSALLCPVLRLLHPFFYPTDPVYVAGDGDLYLLGSRVVDCPPYAGAGNPEARGFVYVFPGT
jgi:hypothetical protein